MMFSEGIEKEHWLHLLMFSGGIEKEYWFQVN